MSRLAKLKAIVPAPARRALKRALGIRPQLDPDWQILAPAGPVPTPHVVLDVGAYLGGFLHTWRKWCPLAEIHAFEPAEESFAQLRRDYGADPRLRLVQSGVGDAPGQLEFNVSPAARYFNSFLAPDQKTLAEVHYQTGQMTRRIVPVTTLDDYCAGARLTAIHLIKIDVQGFELKVLQGAVKRTLPMTGYLMVESGIRPFYEGAPRFSDVFNFMTAHGFHLIGMRSYHRGNLTLMEADLLFRRDDLMPPVDPNEKVDKFVQHIG